MDADRNETVELSGVTIPLDHQIFSPKLIAAFRAGKYEQREAQALPDIIEEGDRILEIGAGVGYLSALAARDPRTAAVRVYEANPLLIPLINHVHKINNIDNVEVIHGVLSNAAAGSKSRFYLRRDFWASSLLEKPWDYERTVEVDNISFSGEIDDFQPTLIICDIEGGELELFRGGHLSGVERVYMEVHQEVLGGQGMKKLFDAMSENGFHYNQWHSCGNIVLFSRVDG